MRYNLGKLNPSQKANILKNLLQEYNLWEDTYQIKPSTTNNESCSNYYLFPITVEQAKTIHRIILLRIREGFPDAEISDDQTLIQHSAKDEQETLTISYLAIDRMILAENNKPRKREEKKTLPVESFSTASEVKDKKQIPIEPVELFIPVCPFEGDEIHFGSIHADKNGVYIFIPIINGDHIGTDNTCKSLLAIKGCFGEQMGVESIESSITSYIRRLQFELSMFGMLTIEASSKYTTFIQQKRNRLSQLERYQELLKEMGDHHGVKSNDKSFPPSIQQLIGKKQNCVSISLSPAEEHTPLGVDPKFALFSVTRAHEKSHQTCASSGLGFELRKMLGDVNAKLMDRKPQGIRDIIIQKAGKKYLKYVENQKVEDQKQEPIINSDIANDNDLDFLKNCITEAYADFLKENVPKFYPSFVTKMPDAKSPERKKWDPLELNSAIANHESGAKAFVFINETEKKPIAVNLSYFKEKFGAADEKELSGTGFAVTDWASYLLNSTVPDVTFSELEKEAKTSPFNTKDEKQDKEIDKFSLRCQMFLAAINIFCHAKHLSSENFGKVIEKNAQLCANLMSQIQHAINDGLSIEDTIFAIINNSVTNNNPFRLSQPLGEDEQNRIKERFRILYNASLESPHDDEYIFFLEEREGPFYIVKNTISLPLEEFINASSLKSLEEKFFGSSAKIHLPRASELKQHQVTKAGLSPKGLTFNVNLTALLSDQKQDPSDFLALVLTTPVPGTGKKVVSDDKLITLEHRQQILNSPWWPNIRKKVLEELSEADLQKFLLWEPPKKASKFQFNTFNSKTTSSSPYVGPSGSISVGLTDYLEENKKPDPLVEEKNTTKENVSKENASEEEKIEFKEKKKKLEDGNTWGNNLTHIENVKKEIDDKDLIETKNTENTKNTDTPLLDSPVEISPSSTEAITSPHLQTKSSLTNRFILTRMVMFAAVSGITVWSLIEDTLSTHSFTLMWACSLSHWNLIFVTIHQGLELVLRDCQAQKHPNLVSKLRAVGLNISLIVTGSFWICSILNNPHLNGVSFLNILIHSLPALLYVADTCWNRPKFSLVQNKCESLKTYCFPSVLFAFAYIVFNAAYSFLGGQYEQSQEEYFHFLLDWQKNPVTAALHSILGIVAVAGLTALTTLLIHLLYSPKPIPNTTHIISGGGKQGQFSSPLLKDSVSAMTPPASPDNTLS